jgi:AcrR family transcriptional regulator
MGRLAARKSRARKRPTMRVGRPPRKLAGEVDERILAAAAQVFLERGLVGASIDEIARSARAGKPTIYARFPSKEALFAAVGMRNAANVRARFESRAPAGATIEERLVSMATDVLDRLLVDEVIDFMRLSIAEARRSPDLANVGRMARARAEQSIARVLSDIAPPDVICTFPAFAPDRIERTTRFFMDLVVARFLMRALTGEDLKLLRAEIPAHVARSIPFFLAACRLAADGGSQG